jgi:hypothetical protein
MGGTDKLRLSVVLLSREDSGKHGQAQFVRGAVCEREQSVLRTNEVCPWHRLQEMTMKDTDKASLSVPPFVRATGNEHGL